MLEGKGIWIWEIWRCEGGNAAQIVNVVQAAGLTHVVVKVADGRDRYPYQAQHNAMLLAAIPALQNAGIVVWGWHFVYGRDPHHTAVRIAAQEADRVVERVTSLNLAGLAVDFEKTGHPTLTYHGDTTDARTYMQRLRNALGADFPIGGASARFPQYHPELPWDEFMNHCSVAMPQMYWVQSSPEHDLPCSIQAYSARWPHLLYIPIGAAYGEAGWTATPDEIRRFLEEVRALGLTAASFWSWQHARHDVSNPHYPGTELWDAIAAFDWVGGAPPTKTVWVTLAQGLKFRSAPDPTNASWVDQIIVPFGTKLTAIGSPTQPDQYGFRFQRIRTSEAFVPAQARGRLGWVTHSSSTAVYLTEQDPGDVPTKAVWVNWAPGLKFRNAPDPTNASWVDRIVIPHHTGLIAIGHPTPPDQYGFRFQRVRTPEGREGWVTYSSKAQVYLSDTRP